MSGALDVIAIQHDDGSITCTPFHVRFGKFKILRSRDKTVRVFVNGKRTELVMRVSTALEPRCTQSCFPRGQSAYSKSYMQLGAAGEAYFLHAKHPEVLASLRSEAPSHPLTNSPERAVSRGGARAASLPELHQDGSVTVDGVKVGTVQDWSSSAAEPAAAIASSSSSSLPTPLVSDEVQDRRELSPLEAEAQAIDNDRRARQEERAAVELVAAAAAYEAQQAGQDPVAAAEAAARVVSEAVTHARGTAHVGLNRLPHNAQAERRRHGRHGSLSDSEALLADGSSSAHRKRSPLHDTLLSSHRGRASQSPQQDKTSQVEDVRSISDTEVQPVINFSRGQPRVSAAALQLDRGPGLQGMRPGQITGIGGLRKLHTRRDSGGGLSALSAVDATLNLEGPATPVEVREMLVARQKEHDAILQGDVFAPHPRQDMTEHSMAPPMALTLDRVDDAVATVGGAVVKAAAELVDVAELAKDAVGRVMGESVQAALVAGEQVLSPPDATAASSPIKQGASKSYSPARSRGLRPQSTSRGGRDSSKEGRRRAQEGTGSVLGSVFRYITGRNRYQYDLSDDSEASPDSGDGKSTAGREGAANGGTPGNRGPDSAGTVIDLMKASARTVQEAKARRASRHAKVRRRSTGGALGLLSSQLAMETVGSTSDGEATPSLPALAVPTQAEGALSAVVVPPWHASKRYLSSLDRSVSFDGPRPSAGTVVPPHSPAVSSTRNSTLSPLSQGLPAPASPPRLHSSSVPLTSPPRHGSHATVASDAGPFELTGLPPQAPSTPASAAPRRWFSNFFGSDHHSADGSMAPSVSTIPAVAEVDAVHASVQPSTLPGVLVARTPSGEEARRFASASAPSTGLRGAMPRTNWFETTDGPSSIAPTEEQARHKPSNSVSSTLSSASSAASHGSQSTTVRVGAPLTPGLKRQITGLIGELPEVPVGPVRDSEHALQQTFVPVLTATLVPHLQVQPPSVRPQAERARGIPPADRFPVSTFVPSRSSKAGFLTMVPRGGISAQSGMLPRALAACAPGKHGTLLAGAALPGPVRRLQRSVSFDLTALTPNQKSLCMTAFGSWIEQTSAAPSQALSSSAVDGSQLLLPTLPQQQRRISKRERLFGWIPYLGPLVIPKDSQSAVQPRVPPKSPMTTNAVFPPLSPGLSAIVSRKGSIDDLEYGTARSGEQVRAGEAMPTSTSVPPVGGGLRSLSTSPLEGEDRRSMQTGSGHESDSGSVVSMNSSMIGLAEFTRSLLPNSEDLKLLPLEPGQNTLTFEVEDGVQVSSSLFLWDWKAPIVVSDVDGTITKSDVLGHIFFYVGRDWTHPGVAQLYSNLHANGYNLVYLTSRAIGQTNATKEYLAGIRQTAVSEADERAASTKSSGAPTRSSPLTTGGKGTVPLSDQAALLVTANNPGQVDVVGGTADVLPASASALATGNAGAVSGGGIEGLLAASETRQAQVPVFKLPGGPVITSPDRLLTAFTREVILRKPQEFKIAALRDIQRLFPSGHNPFHAGFGNRDTDVISYRAVGVPEGKIFVIDPAGAVKQVNQTYNKSYAAINGLVQEMFPLVRHLSIEAHGAGARNGQPVPVDEVYTDAYYWRKAYKATLDDDLAALLGTGKSKDVGKEGKVKDSVGTAGVGAGGAATKETGHTGKHGKHGEAKSGTASAQVQHTPARGKPPASASSAIDPLQESMKAALNTLALQGLSMPAAPVSAHMATGGKGAQHQRSAVKASVPTPASSGRA